MLPSSLPPSATHLRDLDGPPFCWDLDDPDCGRSSSCYRVSSSKLKLNFLAFEKHPHKVFRAGMISPKNQKPRCK